MDWDPGVARLKHWSLSSCVMVSPASGRYLGLESGKDPMLWLLSRPYQFSPLIFQVMTLNNDFEKLYVKREFTPQACVCGCASFLAGACALGEFECMLGKGGRAR